MGECCLAEALQWSGSRKQTGSVCRSVSLLSLTLYSLSLRVGAQTASHVGRRKSEYVSKQQKSVDSRSSLSFSQSLIIFGERKHRPHTPSSHQMEGVKGFYFFGGVKLSDSCKSEYKTQFVVKFISLPHITSHGLESV